MLSILVNAYACSPDIGSEPGMGWNWCINLAKHCQLHIITEGINENKIAKALQTLPQGKNMHFYYNPVSEKVREICRNQGDWRFYWYYEKWQRKTYAMALDIIANNHIDIVHQLNMIGFREPGFLWKIDNIPFIWGPIGGLMDVPLNYIASQNVKKMIIASIKSMINVLQLKYHTRVRKAAKRASFIVGAARESVKKMERFYGKNAILLNETGCYFNNFIPLKSYKNDDMFNIVWIGRFLYTKKLDLALKTISKLTHLKKIKFHIVGFGNEKEVKYHKKLAESLNIGDISVWYGNVAHATVQEIMQKSDFLFFTSVAEGTPHSVLEAISNCLPVVCFDCCGQGDSVNDKVGVKIKLSNPQQSVNEFAEKIEALYHHRELLEEMSRNCIVLRKELSWDNKALQMLNLYRQAKENFIVKEYNN